MAVVSTTPQPFQSGFQLVDGNKLNAVIAADLVSATDGITAGAGTNAIQLTTVMDRVAITVNPGDSIRLPPGIPGSAVSIDNDSSLYISVFPFGTDTIEDTTSPQQQLAGQDTIYVCPALGKWYVTNSVSSAGSLVAAGTSATNAFQLSNGWNDITNVASGTGAILPNSSQGLIIAVFNDVANPIKIYGRGTDTIDGVAGATGVTLTNTKRCLYICFAAGAWISAQLGVTSA